MVSFTLAFYNNNILFYKTLASGKCRSVSIKCIIWKYVLNILNQSVSCVMVSFAILIFLLTNHRLVPVVTSWCQSS